MPLYIGAADHLARRRTGCRAATRRCGPSSDIFEHVNRAAGTRLPRDRFIELRCSVSAAAGVARVPSRWRLLVVGDGLGDTTYERSRSRPRSPPGANQRASCRRRPTTLIHDLHWRGVASRTAAHGAPTGALRAALAALTVPTSTTAIMAPKERRSTQLPTAPQPQVDLSDRRKWISLRPAPMPYLTHGVKPVTQPAAAERPATAGRGIEVCHPLHTASSGVVHPFAHPALSFG